MFRKTELMLLAEPIIDFESPGIDAWSSDEWWLNKGGAELWHFAEVKDPCIS